MAEWQSLALQLLSLAIAAFCGWSVTRRGPSLMTAFVVGLVLTTLGQFVIMPGGPGECGTVGVVPVLCVAIALSTNVVRSKRDRRKGLR